jgi:hypothetical protein
MPPEHQRTSPMHRIFEIQDGLHQIHRFASILSSRVQMQQDKDQGKLGADAEFKATVSGYELELFSALESDGEYLPKFAAFQVVAQKLSAFSPHGPVSEDWSTHPQDAWSLSFYQQLKAFSSSVGVPTQLFLYNDMDLAAFWASTNDMQQQFADLLRFVYDCSTQRKESPHKAMVQDIAEWTELCSYCAWILTQVHSADCIVVYTALMAQRKLLNTELQAMVHQVALHTAGLESTISPPPPRPQTAPRGRKSSRRVPPKTARSQMNTLFNDLLALS